MSNVAIIVACEGQTEETFVNRILAPTLAARSVFVTPTLVDAQGGNLNRQRVLRYLRNTLRTRQNAYVTTFFDLYALPRNFPGHAEAEPHPDPLDRARKIETEFHTEVVRIAECRPERFFPHIQPYEFEALLFSDTAQFPRENSAWQRHVHALETARQSADSPEHINDGQETHPSARLKQLRPRYNKVRHGTAVSERIGLERIRAECKHFDAWLTRMENLPPLQAEA